MADQPLFLLNRKELEKKLKGLFKILQSNINNYCNKQEHLMISFVYLFLIDTISIVSAKIHFHCSHIIINGSIKYAFLLYLWLFEKVFL